MPELDEIGPFLKARWDETAQEARAAGGGAWVTGCRCEVGCREYPDCTRVEGGRMTIGEGGHNVDQANHIARQDPARTLRRIEGLRKVLDEHKPGKTVGWGKYRTTSCEG